MCLFTHFAAGALVGGLTGQPVPGALAGIASHALLDMLPHYDHPDWRLEIVGGGLALMLLLFMPFGTLPAVLGGLGGMLPDLENLFQKLGLYSRRRFIFPTHNGLLPHGRRLPPGSLAWQVGIFAACFLVLGLVRGPASAVAAQTATDTAVLGRAEITILQSGPDRTVVRLNIPVERDPVDWESLTAEQILWGDPPTIDEQAPADRRFGPPRLVYSLAVPTSRRPDLRVTALSWYREPRGTSRSGGPVQVSDPGIFRSVPLAQIVVEPGLDGGVLASVTVEIDHPRQAPYAASLDPGKAVGDDLPAPVKIARILNRDLWRTLSLGAARQAATAAKARPAANDLFGLTTHWLRLDVRTSGPVRLTGAELSNMGLDSTVVDPRKLRLFRGGGLALDTDPTLADADQSDRIGLNEVAIEVLDGGDQEWNLDDELRFFAVGPDAWRDRFDPAAERLDFSNHPYDDHATYWLSWEDERTASPLPGSARRMAVDAATPGGGTEVATGRVRLHREKQLLDTGGLFADNWAWDNFVYSSRQDTFTLRHPVNGSSARYVVDIRGNYYSITTTYPFRAECWLNGSAGDKAALDFTSFDQINPDSLRVRVVGETTSLVDGLNTLTLSNASVALNDNVDKQTLSLDSFDVSYLADLVVDAGDGPLSVLYNAADPTLPGTDLTLRVRAPGGGDLNVWDVTDPAAPRILTGVPDGQDPDILRLGYTLTGTADHELLLVRGAGFGSVHAGTRAEPVALRSEPTDVDYLVVYAPEFSLAATALAGYHDAALVGVSDPAAAVVLDRDIYDNFSGGQKDPLAIRNYLRYVYEQGGHRLKYVCFVGNASRDYRNYLDHQEEQGLWDFLPTMIRTAFPQYPTVNTYRTAYASDDGLVSFDAPLPGALDYPDLACGRLPAKTAGEAVDMVSRSIAYDGTPDAGPWRNRVMFAADDADRPDFGGYPLTQETYHTVEADVLTEQYLPSSLDLQKIYGVTYSFPSPSSNVKPEMRNDIIAALDEGTTIFHYVGHGAEDNLADEQVFQSRDIPNLVNGMKRPVFVAFSCDVGVYDSPSRLSMAEQFLSSDGGGAIACITASQVSYAGYNDLLSDAFYGELFPGAQVDPTISLGQALIAAKAQMTGSGTNNSQHFSIMGDPAVRFPHPAADLAFAAGSPDSLRTGERQVVVMSADGTEAPQAGESYDLRIEDSAYDQTYPVYKRYRNSNPPPEYTYVPVVRTYRKRGATVFRGTGVVESGTLEIPFINPAQFRHGDDARIRVLVNGTSGDRAGVMRLSAVTGSGTGNDLTGPRIDLAFEDGLYRVKSGAPLTATLTDSSGIAILGTSPGNSLLLEFDGSGFMSDVTESFSFAPNSYTRGSLSFPLPGDLDLGRHSAALHASDALGNVGSDTLSFLLIPEGVRGLENVTVFPNPTPGPCRLLVDLSDPMTVQWEIYTLAGRRVRTVRRDFGSGGPVILNWDGRDDRGDEIANGTYLFVLRGLAASADEREITRTGKLVMMR